MPVELLNTLTGELVKNIWILILPILASLFFKTTISRFVDGLLWHYGRTYDVDDVVIVDGVYARIVRANLWKTTFYTYEITSDGIVLYGKVMVVSNDQLWHKKVEKMLPLHEIPKNYIKIPTDSNS